jgi:hypothetical protein
LKIGVAAAASFLVELTKQFSSRRKKAKLGGNDTLKEVNKYGYHFYWSLAWYNSTSPFIPCFWITQTDCCG